MYRGRGRSIVYTRSRGGGRGNRGRPYGKKFPGGERTSFTVSDDGSEFHFCHPKSMKVDFDLLKDYKSNLKYFGGYSEDIEGNFKNDKSFVRFLNTDYLPQEDSKEKKVELNLSTMQESTTRHSSTLDKNSENLFTWILSNKDNLTEVLSYETKFIFLKSVFSKLLRIPYRFNDQAIFYAVYLNGVIYLRNEKRKEPNSLIPEKSRLNRKFRRCVTHGENDEEGVACYQFYRSAVTAKLGPHNLLFSDSTDCFNLDICELDSIGPASSVLLQSWEDNSTTNNRLEKFEMFEWCISLATMNIPHVLVGFRNKDDVVKVNLKLYTEDDLSQHGKPHWDINVGFTFAKNALSFIEKTTKAKPGTVFSFTKNKKESHIKAEEINKEHIKAKEKHMEKFPPKWFNEKLKE